MSGNWKKFFCCCSLAVCLFTFVVFTVSYDVREYSKYFLSFSFSSKRIQFSAYNISNEGDMYIDALPRSVRKTLLDSEVVEKTRYSVVSLNRPFLERIAFYNYVLSVYRNKTLQQLNTGQLVAWPTRVGTIYSDVDSFLNQLASDDHVTSVMTIYLKYVGPALADRNWDSRSSKTHANLLIHDYYNWQGPSPHCVNVASEAR